jgi:hypothetical protein
MRKITKLIYVCRDADDDFASLVLYINNLYLRHNNHKK